MVELDHSYRERVINRQLHTYMYGEVIHPPPGVNAGTQGGEGDIDFVLAPSSTVINFSDLTIYRIGAGKSMPTITSFQQFLHVIQRVWHPLPLSPSGQIE